MARETQWEAVDWSEEAGTRHYDGRSILLTMNVFAVVCTYAVF